MENWVFDSFKYNLGKQNIKWDEDFILYLVPHLEQSDYRGINNAKLEAIIKDSTKAGYIYGLNMKTINDLTNKESENFYESLEQYPASAYIFSDEYNGTLVKSDYDYYSLGATHQEVYKGVKNGKIPFNKAYWEKKYQFASEFSESEFDYYGIPKSTMQENKVRLSNTRDKLYNINNHAQWNSKKDATYYPQGNGLIVYCSGSKYKGPVCYFESQQYIKARGELVIDWNNNGLMELK